MWLTDLASNLWGRERVGGKAHHLAELTRWGFQVPRFGVLTSDAYRAFKKDAKFPPELRKEILSWSKESTSKYFAVRSSMTREDGESTSFAGIFDTFLFVEQSQLIDRVLDCYASIESDRAQTYLSNIGLRPSDLGVCVVIQSMIDSHASGVAFSRSPSVNSGLVYIEAGLGLGEGVVSGQVDVDRFWWDRFGDEVGREISEKSSKMVYDSQTRKVILKEGADESSKNSSVSDSNLKSLAQIVLEIESKMGKPADVEWTIDAEERLWILQARAITHATAPLEVYADTNLAESYPGIVSPFTAEFIPKIYEKVIGEGIAWLGTNRSQMAKLAPYLKTLIREFDGHLYYHLNSYYVMLASLPGGASNVKAWHQMIGGHSSLNPKGGAFQQSFLGGLLAQVRLLWLWLRHDSLFGNFLKTNELALNDWKQRIQSLSSSQGAATFQLKMVDEINGWGLTILNDFLVIIGLKLMGRILGKYGFGEKELLPLLKTSDGVDSLEAPKALAQLVRDLPQSFLERFGSYPSKATDPDWDGVYDWLRREGYSHQTDALDLYLRKFGERSFEELKLESMPFSQSPRLFHEILSWYQGGSFESPKGTTEPFDLSRLNWPDRRVLGLLTHLTRKAVQARESTRLMRGRFYGLLRLAVLRTSSLLKQERPDLFAGFSKRDFFAVKMTEYESYGAGRISAEELRDRLQQGLTLWQAQSSLQHPEKFCHSDLDATPIYKQELPKGPRQQSEGEIKGLGASEGLVRGKALVISDPREALTVPDLAERILVTRSTDPAWIFIMSKCRGLVAEKGSLLSHTAIVGREMGIPTVVGVKDATKRIPNGSEIEINGKSGEVRIG